jgi:WD40 repeat protein/serine/threonine protein kinase
MTTPLACDEDLVRRLPLPLAQLYRRAHNAHTALERHLTAFYLWEAALKLLASVAVVEYADRPEHDPQLAERLTGLARPSLGQWWEFARRLVPILADGDAEFLKLRDLLLGAARDDLPRAAGLDAALREALDGQAGARATVRLTELFDRLVRYRNRELGHGAAGQRGGDFYDRMGRALLAGVAELLGRLDVLAGRRLLYVAEVRQAAGCWLVQRYELLGEAARRVESLELPRDATSRLPDAGRVYLEPPAGGPPRPLHPLLLYEADTGEPLFLNSRRGRRRAEYLCYTTGRTLDRPDLGGEQRALLARVLGLDVAESQAEQWAARSQAEEPAGEPAPAPRRQLGEFELLSELGRGGMGVVYRAWQPSLGRQVALKCLYQTGDPLAEARFRREIKSLGRVEHPHLVKVYTSGSDGEQWFYTMELVEGASLAAVCARLSAAGSTAAGLDAATWHQAVTSAADEARQAEKPLSDPGEGRPPAARPEKPGREAPARLPGRDYVRHVAGVVRQVAEAAHALHEAGIVHRDITPANVLVGAEGGQAVLMDLGLAQLADEEQGRLTRTRQFVGTLRYASPQQVLAAGKLDRRADVYSLGATLWELLTLRPLYGATEETPTPELMERIQRQEPGRPRKHNSAVPRDLEAVVLKCLEKELPKRYATARELAEDLGRFLAGEPVRARPVGGVGRGWRWVRRRPVLAALLLVSGLALLALAGGGVAAYYGTWLHDAYVRLEGAKAQADQARAEAEEARRGQETQRQRAEGLLYFMSIERAQSAWRENDVPRMLQVLEDCKPELRRWEWHYLRRLCHSDLLTLEGHVGAATCVCFSPDGRRLASGSGGYDEDQEQGYGEVKVWDLETGREALTLQGHTDVVRAVCFSPDGKRLASAGGYDKTVKVWDAQTGQELLTLEGHTDAVGAVCFSPDGKRLASAGSDQTVKVWDAQTGQVQLTLKGHTETVESVCFSPDGRRLASASLDGTVKVWDAQTGQEQLTLKGNTGGQCVCFSPDGQRLAGALRDGTVKVWDAQAGQEALSFQGHTTVTVSVCFSPDGRRLASASEDRTVKVWDAQTGQEQRTLKGHTGAVLGVCFSPDGRRLASASSDKTVKVWDAQAGQEALSLQGLTGEVNGVCFSPDGKRLAGAGGELGKSGEVRVWDVQTGQEALTVKGHTDQVNGVAFSPDGRRLASASRDRTVKVWDARTGQELLCLQGHADQVNGVAYSPDGRRLVTASGDTTLKVWDAQTGQETLTLKGHTAAVSCVAFSPEGKRLASASVGYDRKKRLGYGEVKVWDLETGQEALTLQGPPAQFSSVAFSPDGQRLASNSDDRTVKVWDARTGQELLALQGHTDQVKGVAFSPDGQRLASASWDETVKVWDVRTGQEILTLKGHTSWVESVCFSPDGRRLASAGGTAGEPGEVKVWDATSPRHADPAEAGSGKR